MFGPEKVRGILGQTLLHLINILLLYLRLLDSDIIYPRDYGPFLMLNPKQTFDVIIVGGGISGSVLANRLVKTTDWHVLILEAGSVPNSNHEVPVFHERLRTKEKGWEYWTERDDKCCQSMVGKRCKLYTGKVLGGSSSVSNMHYERAFVTDLLDWDYVMNYSEAIKYYMLNEKYPSEWHLNISADLKVDLKSNKKPSVDLEVSANLCNPSSKYSLQSKLKRTELAASVEARLEEYNNIQCDLGTFGDVDLNFFDNQYPITKVLVEAVKLKGLTVTSPCLQESGYYSVPGYIKDGLRNNFAKAFLGPINSTKQLYVVQHAYVTKIYSDCPIDKRVRGVEVFINGLKYTLKARYEVIVATGAINAAKLMMLSGFGPMDHLTDYNIRTQANLTVGDNLQDHFGVPILISIGSEKMKHYFDLADSTYEFLKFRRGRFTQTDLNDVVGAINTTESGFPDIKIYHYYFYQNDPDLEIFMNNRGYIKKVINSAKCMNEDTDVLIMMPVLLKPKSRGTIRLQTSNPFEPPIIVGKFLSEPEDVVTLIKAFGYIEELVGTEPFKNINATLLHIDIPNCRNLKFCTAQYVQCYIANMGTPLSNSVGTVKFGNATLDENACVDNKFIIDNMRHLRVIGPGVFPNSISGNMDGTVAMLARKAADDIKNSWPVKPEKK